MNIIDKIDDHLTKENDRKRENHNAYDIAACMRQLFYKWVSEPATNPITAGGYWKMRAGNKLHDLIYEFFKEMDWEVLTEVGSKKKLPELEHDISYRVDCMYTVPGSDEWTIIEVKSSYGNGIRALQRSGEPKESDIMQILLYMHLENISKGVLLYVARDDGYRMEFHLELKDGILYVDNKPTEYTFQKILDKLVQLEEHLKEVNLPDRDYKVAIKNGEIKKKFTKNKVDYKSDWNCSYCQWCDMCWEYEIEKYKESDNSESFKS